MAIRLLLIALAGSCGALSRYALSSLGQRLFGAQFPWGTVIVNTVGCFAAGLLFALFESRWQLNSEARIVVFVGFLGAFTTFSSVMLEASNFARGGQWFSAAANIVLQNALGVVAIFAGLAVARLISGAWAA